MVLFSRECEFHSGCYAYGHAVSLVFGKILTMKSYLFQGQALAKINIGDVLDCDGDWAGALDAFEEGYRYSFFFSFLTFLVNQIITGNMESVMAS